MRRGHNNSLAIFEEPPVEEGTEQLCIALAGSVKGWEL